MSPKYCFNSHFSSLLTPIPLILVVRRHKTINNNNNNNVSHVSFRSINSPFCYLATKANFPDKNLEQNRKMSLEIFPIKLSDILITKSSSCLGTQISSNQTQSILDASATNQKSHQLPVDSQLTNFQTNQNINNQKTNHHFSINTRKKLNDDHHHQYNSQDKDYEPPTTPPYHHNLVVSYENHKSLEENIYNKNCK